MSAINTKQKNAKNYMINSITHNKEKKKYINTKKITVTWWTEECEREDPTSKTKLRFLQMRAIKQRVFRKA